MAIAWSLLFSVRGIAITAHSDIFRVPIPAELPAHPRVFCTGEDVARIRRDLAAGDLYTVACVEQIQARAATALQKAGTVLEKLSAGDLANAAALAQSFAVTGDVRAGEACRDLLVASAKLYRALKTTAASGRVADSTLREGPVAVNAAMAYDLIAGAPFLGDEQRRAIEDDLLRTMGRECGHGCHHLNSSNWRTWALAIVASCGFATGDRELIEEAVNGVYDPKRKAYLYGAVQTLTHSIFSDGIHWERSMGYTYYTASALMYVLVAAKNSGIDLWHAVLPGVTEPFEGCAPHEEFGPAGPRSVRAFLDAPFYFAFPDGSFSLVGDSGTRRLGPHPIYELAWREYHDPKYAWLIHGDRTSRDAGAPAGWQLWRARGEPEGEWLAEGGEGNVPAFRLRCSGQDRVALVQDVTVPADRPATVSGKVKALSMAGASAHIRCNIGRQALYTQRVTRPGPWCEVRVALAPKPDAQPGDNRRVRLHVFLEEGAGEVLWTDIRATVEGDGQNLVRNGSFGASRVDGRRLDFWSLVHSPAQVPEGHYSLSEDAAIGLSGRHENGCTLLPVGGFAVLRSNASDPNATAVNLGFGPYGSGHDHPDRLHLDVYAAGEVLCPDAGSWGYDNPMHLTWANQTIAHNTVTVDEISQEPQGSSKSIWAAERGTQRVFGVLRLFHPGTHLKAARATCDTAYPGVVLDRTVCLVGAYVVDVFRVRSDEDHTYDLAWHGPGAVTPDFGVESFSRNPFQAQGYVHLADVRRAVPAAATIRVDFARGENSLRLWQVHPGGGELFCAKDPKKNGDTSVLLSRRRGTDTVFVSILEPKVAESGIESVLASRADGVLCLTIVSRTGTDVLRLDRGDRGTVGLWRQDAFGREVAVDQAKPGGA